MTALEGRVMLRRFWQWITAPCPSCDHEHTRWEAVNYEVGGAYEVCDDCGADVNR